MEVEATAPQARGGRRDVLQGRPVKPLLIAPLLDRPREGAEERSGPVRPTRKRRGGREGLGARGRGHKERTSPVRLSRESRGDGRQLAQKIPEAGLFTYSRKVRVLLEGLGVVPPRSERFLEPREGVVQVP